jgi:hypothetical protein
MGLLSSVVTFLLAAVIPPTPCPFEAHYLWLSRPNNIPISILPPNPTLPNSTAIFDSANRSAAYDPNLYPTFEAVLAPMTTMTIFLQNTTLSSVPACTQRSHDVIRAWASRGAMTGRVNPYSMLLHRILSGDIAITYLTRPRQPVIRYNNSPWFRQLHIAILRQPVPYMNNFRAFEFRALVTTAMAANIPYSNFMTTINQFLGTVIRNGTITTEIRGLKTIQYHIYFLGPLFDTLYILWKNTGLRLHTTQGASIGAVVKTLEEKPPVTFMRLLGYAPYPVPGPATIVIRRKWDCLRTGVSCSLFAQLDNIQRRPKT